MDKDRTFLEIESTILENENNFEARKNTYLGKNKIITNLKY